MCEARWKEIEKVGTRETLYDLEKDFVEVWQTLGRSVLEKSIGDIPENHRKKSQ